MSLAMHSLECWKALCRSTLGRRCIGHAHHARSVLIASLRRPIGPYSLCAFVRVYLFGWTSCPISDKVFSSSPLYRNLLISSAVTMIHFSSCSLRAFRHRSTGEFHAYPDLYIPLILWLLASRPVRRGACKTSRIDTRDVGFTYEEGSLLWERECSCGF
jgi:hypothetical protein